jgi:type III restriction enzyme
VPLFANAPTFGKVPLAAIARLSLVVEGQEQAIGREAAELIRVALVQQKMLDGESRIQPAFDPRKLGFKIEMPVGNEDLTPR